MHEAGNLARASEIYIKIIQAAPQTHEALHLLGVINYQKGLFEPAVALIGNAIQIAPKVPAYHNNLGNALMGVANLDAAISSYKKALSLKPDYPEAINNIGAVLHEKGRFEEEISYYKTGLNKLPGETSLLNGLIKAMKEACLWENLDTYISQITTATENALKQGILPPLTPYHSLTLPISPQLKKEVSINYAEKVFGHIKPAFDHNSNANKKIRIGYVSADYRDHPTAHLIKGLLKHHDRDKFEVYAYSLGKDDNSEHRKAIVENSDYFIDMFNMSTGDVANRIYNDKIDILMDVMGYIQNAVPAIFALRPAPVQISYLAYPGTMGAKFIDYLVTDRIAVPPEHEDNYTENLLFMPDTYFVTDTSQKTAEPPSRIECNLPEDKFVFCSFNKSNKIDKNVFDCWMEILKEVPESVLWLFSNNEFTQQNLYSEAEKRGVSSERIIFAGRLPKDQHLARHKHADLFLDCFTVNAHTTAIDALYAGLPVITKTGNDIISRASSSVLNAAGLHELITSDIESYKALAIKYAKEPGELSKLNKKRLSGSNALFDTKKYVENLETLLIELPQKIEK